jgi:predicted dehydrogenase
MTYQRDFGRRLKVGMVGIGSHTYRNLLPTMNFLPVELRALCVKSDLERARITAAQYGADGVYDDPAEMYAREELDAVFICVSPQAHPALTIQALDAGLHVWLEKPPAMGASQIEEMMSHRHGRSVTVGFKKAFTPAAVKAREVAASPQYGNLQSILAIYPMSLPEDGEAVLEDGRFINWLANGVHPLSFILSVGGPVGAVTTHTNTRGHGVCVLEFENGVMGDFHMGAGPHPMETYALYGEGWHLRVENSIRITLQRGTPLDYATSTTFAPPGFDSGAIQWEASYCLATLENKALFVQGIYGEMMAFCNGVLQGTPPHLGSLEFALEVMRVYEAGLRSKGRTISLH